MAWTNLSFAYGSVLTSTKMTQLYDDIVADANGDSGSPAQYFKSADQSITSGGLLTIAHGLGTVPRRIGLYARCTTAESGFSIGDIVLNLGDNTPGIMGGVGANIVGGDATNIIVRFGSAYASPLVSVNKGTGGLVSLSNANWVLVVEAWKL